MARLTLVASVPVMIGLALMLAICGGATYLAVESRRQVNDAVALTHILNAANLLRADLLTTESSQRGFLLTSHASYRTPYDVASQDAAKMLARLKSLLADDPGQLAVVRHIETEVAAKLAEMQRTFTLFDSGKPDAARALVDTDAGLQLMQRIMDDLASVRNNAVRERNVLLDTQRVNSTLLVIALCFAGIGALLMAVLAMLQVRDHLRLLRRREVQLDHLVTSLEGRVAQRTLALAQANQRFQIALDSSEVTVFHQDRDLVYGWISRGTPGMAAAEILGKTDAGIFPPGAVPALERLKRGVLATGEPARMEVRLDYPSGVRWYDMSVVPVRDADGQVEGLIGGAVDISDRKNHEAHVRLLLREITHRSKNLLAVIQAIMRQTMSHASSATDFTKRFSARLDALAGSLDLLVQEDWRGVTLSDLVRSQLAHHADPESKQILLEGGALKLPPDAAQNIGMALHELATNAAKFGALSVPAGRVRVSWTVTKNKDDSETCCLSWQESGGPVVSAPEKRGFGQVVIERTAARAVAGEVSLTYPPTGVCWILRFPLQRDAVQHAA